MEKKYWWLRPILVAPLALCALLTLLSAFVNIYLFYIEALLLICVTLYVLYKLRGFQQDMFAFLSYLSDNLTLNRRETLETLPFPMLVAGAGGDIIWYNRRCKDDVFMGEDLFGVPVRDIIPKADPTDPKKGQGANIRYKEKLYTVHTATIINDGGQPEGVYFLIDDTALKKYVFEYKESRPSVGIVVIDNYQEIMQDARESEKAQTIGQLETIIENYMLKGNCLLRRLSQDRFLVVAEERQLRKMIERRFDILDQVREVSLSDNVPSTLSIGIGQGAANLQESEKMARQALEMALGRGGDQVAIKTADGFSFYGGTSKGVEKRTKVKSRIMASALSELIMVAENVLIMGHRFGDLDSLGSAVGMYRVIRQMGKPAAIVVQRQTNLAYPLYNRLAANGYQDAFVEPGPAKDLVGEKTLLIVVDTHMPHMLESREIYEKCESVVVIDHHRKMVGHIDNAVLFYHEPYASSASEMITELTQYFGDHVKLTRLDAEALLSGIMLDTKNFVMKTGVRTFEAAAYLRKQGADTIEVRKLFSNTMDDYQKKTRLVSSAEVYRGCAIASGEYTEDIKLIAPQAADELLGIDGVSASFVMYEYGDGVSFSARSMGGMNVQVIMEMLGGGGHMTMAGAQLSGITMDPARQKLLEAIDKYYEERPKENPDRKESNS
ncbi:MAG: DHH family phosphoesterase [Oscillospiraceae bacterium]|nr:DHH family phosphoesterase [Oscillospiraceae bacterium]